MTRNNLKWFFIAILLTLNFLVWQKIISIKQEPALKVIFLDVGQGDAILIETKGGNQVLIDGGSNDRVLRELSKFMPFFDRSIDMIVATHPDSDHVGGLVEVLSRFNSRIFLESNSKSQTLVYQSLEEALKRKNGEITRIIAKRGMVFDLGNDIYLKVLFPDIDASKLEPNTASIITRVEYGETSFLLTGDSPISIENYLVAIDKERLDVDVLKAGHHGSKTSSSVAFLGFTSPDYVVISAGLNNRYGHPHKEVIDRLEALGVEILQTSKEGSISFISDGEEIRVKK